MLAEIGKIENQFGLLEPPQKGTGWSKLVPEKFREFVMPTVSAQELANRLGVSRGAMYKSQLGIDTAFLKERILPLVLSADVACHVFQNKEKAREWMVSPNAYFFGQTPVDVCLQGDGQGVIELLQRHHPKHDVNGSR